MYLYMYMYRIYVHYFEKKLVARSCSLLVFAPNIRYCLLHLIKPENVGVDQVWFPYRHSRTATFHHSQ